MDDWLQVETTVASQRGPLLTLSQKILRDDQVLLTAEVLVVSIKDNKPARLPDDLAQRFAVYAQA